MGMLTRAAAKLLGVSPEVAPLPPTRRKSKKSSKESSREPKELSLPTAQLSTNDLSPQASSLPRHSRSAPRTPSPHEKPTRPRIRVIIGKDKEHGQKERSLHETPHSINTFGKINSPNTCERESYASCLGTKSPARTQIKKTSITKECSRPDGESNISNATAINRCRESAEAHEGLYYDVHREKIFDDDVEGNVEFLRSNRMKMNIPPSDANMPVVSLRNYIRRPKLNLVAREESNCSMESELPGTQSQETTESNDEQSQRTATAQPITSEDAVVANDYKTESNASFNDCSSPPPIPEPIEAESTHAEYQLRDSAAFHDNSQTNDLVYKLLTTISPDVHFPVPPDTIREQLRMAKVGDSCIVAWSFDQTPRLNISSGVVQATQKRGTKRKLAIKYTGIHGYKVEESFSGHIPPQANVRIYKLIWDSGNIESSTAAPTQTICISTDSDLDHEPMPTLRTVSQWNQSRTGMFGYGRLRHS